MAYTPAKRPETDTAALSVATARRVNDMLEKNRGAIMATLPRGFNYDRMCRTVINAISTTPLLAKCTPASLFLSTVRGFSLGLEPNGPLAESYLVPFWNSKKNAYEAQFMPGYRGLQNLARRSGDLDEMYSNVVCEKDRFEVHAGTERKIVHVPDYTKDRGKPVCYYAVFRLRTGSFDFEVMSMEEIDKVRRSSKASEKGPWVDWPEEMAKKTVMKRLLKRAPMSIELADAVRLDNAAATGEASGDIIDVEGIEIDEETPEEVRREINDQRKDDLKKKIENRAAPAMPPQNSADPVAESCRRGAAADKKADELPM